MRQHDSVIVNGNPLRLGLFGANCSSRRTYARLPDPWEASGENNVRLAQLVDEVGMACIVPIARWKGYGGRVKPQRLQL
jgi:dimethylsulfone monooxygenase